MTAAATKAETKGERTRAKLVATTADLLTRQGYHATGLAQIIEASGAPRGSLYFYFPGGKEELAVAALQSSSAQWRERLEAIVDAAADQGEAVVSVCRMLADEMVASNFELGCPIATVALEASATSPAVHAAIADHFSDLTASISRRLESIGVPAVISRELATFAIAAIEGALLLARVHRDVQPLLTVGATLRSMIALAPVGAGPRR
jgi:TetR/AcrR family transcriptional regulator, lmrAB and yxaGH operons repressor